MQRCKAQYKKQKKKKQKNRYEERYKKMQRDEIQKRKSYVRLIL